MGAIAAGGLRHEVGSLDNGHGTTRLLIANENNATLKRKHPTMQAQFRTPYPALRHLQHVVRLTRWREHILFTVPVTLLGTVAALYRHIELSKADGRALWALAANVCAVTFAFMLNDLEDAPDDAHDPARRARNVIASGDLQRRAGWVWTLAVGVLALALYVSLGAPAATLGALMLALSFLYSWRPVRLKAWPVVDVLAHVLMLSALLFLTAYTAQGGALWEARLLIWGVVLLSAYGQLYNQLRDYPADRLAGLRNTASLLGKRGTQWTMWAMLAGGLGCFGAALITGWIPPTLAVMVGAVLPLIWLRRSRADMRGTPAIDATGRLQNGAAFAVTLALTGWTCWALWLR